MAVIFCDSNILYADIDSDRYDVIRAIARTEHRVCIPAVVRDELVARKVIAYRAAQTALSAAAAKFAKGAPWIQVPPLSPALDESAAQEYWKGVYADVFEIVPTPAGAADAALEREAYCDKPAKPDENAEGGARDVAIRLTVVDFLHRDPRDEVYFVSANRKDFGDGTSFAPMLERDLSHHRHRFTLSASLESAIEAVTKPVEAPDEGTAFVDPLVSDETSVKVAGAAVHDRRFRDGWSAVDLDHPGGTRYPRVFARERAGTPVTLLIDVTNGTAHRIGEDTWHIATARWALAGLAAHDPASDPGAPTVTMTGAVWRTRMLIGTVPGEAPGVLKSEAIEDPGHGDGPCNDTLKQAATLWRESHSSGEVLLRARVEQQLRRQRLHAFIDTLPGRATAPNGDIPPFTTDTALDAATTVVRWLSPRINAQLNADLTADEED
ncbi:PIN domain-containing protein [Embleya sp. NPDC020630]|uniref:PIN domain-containing protein n=1 Tax=Embleya sp. NPDC020630 TaxID=3363979 RepID=UPI0037AB90FA